MSFFILNKFCDLSLFCKMNQIPIPAKIIRIDENQKDCPIVVVACSATESTNGSWVVRKGFTALRYLKVGNDKNLELKFIIIRVIPDVTVPIRR